MTHPKSVPDVAVTRTQRTAVDVVLASQSPRRRELLALIGVPHRVEPADIDERALPGELPDPHCERLARAKAEVVAARNPDALTIGSDTIVVVDGMILGKPRDVDDAARMLGLLAHRTHEVFTAVAIAYRGAVDSAVERVSVTFGALSGQTIAAYIATGEPMDKAGAYGIQGFGATLIERVDGDYFAVMGLPLRRLVTLLSAAGLDYRFGPIQAAADREL